MSISTKSRGELGGLWRPESQNPHPGLIETVGPRPLDGPACPGHRRADPSAVSSIRDRPGGPLLTSEDEKPVFAAALRLPWSGAENLCAGTSARGHPAAVLDDDLAVLDHGPDRIAPGLIGQRDAVSYTHLRAHETGRN